MSREHLLSGRITIASLATAFLVSLAALTVWGATTLQVAQTMTAAGKYVFSTAMSPDGQLIAVSSYDPQTRVYKIQIFRASDGSLVRDGLEVPGGNSRGVGDLMFVNCKNNQAKEVLCLTGYAFGRGPMIWDGNTGDFIKQLFQGSNPSGGELAVAPGATLGGSAGQPAIAVEGPVGSAATIEIRDENGKPLGAPIPVNKGIGGSPLGDTAIAPDGSYVVTVGEDAYLFIVEGGYQNGQWQWTYRKIKLPGSANTVTVSTYGKIVVSVSQKEVIVIDKKTGKQVAKLNESKGFNNCVVLSDGQTVACGAADGSFGLWDINGNLKEKQNVCPAGVGVTSVSKGPNNSVVVGCNNGTVKILQNASPAPTTTPSPSPSPSPKPSSTSSPTPTSSSSPSPTPTMSPTPTPTNSP